MTAVIVNGRRQDVAEPATVATLIEALTGTTRGSAVVIDGAVIPRSDWPTFSLRDGQEVELITAVQGG
jgi:sulfur carrier protein